MKEILQSYLDFSEESYQLLMDIAREKKVKRNEILFHANKTTSRILLLKEGLLRGYKIIDGKDYTHHFYFENWFATDFESFLTGKPSQIFIEAIDNAVFYEFSKKDFLSLYKKSHQIEVLGRIIAEKAFLATVEKLADMQLLSLTEKYEMLIQRTPSLFLRVPQKHIASYLGVSEQSLSRIKKQTIS